MPASCREEACLPDRAPLMECQPPAVENFFSRPKTKAHYLLRSRNNYGKFCHEETKYFARMRRLGAARLAYRGSIKCLRETEIEREREKVVIGNIAMKRLFTALSRWSIERRKSTAKIRKSGYFALSRVSSWNTLGSVLKVSFPASRSEMTSTDCFCTNAYLFY